MSHIPNRRLPAFPRALKREADTEWRSLNRLCGYILAQWLNERDRERDRERRERGAAG